VELSVSGMGSGSRLIRDMMVAECWLGRVGGDGSVLGLKMSDIQEVSAFNP